MFLQAHKSAVFVIRDNDFPFANRAVQMSQIQFRVTDDLNPEDLLRLECDKYHEDGIHSFVVQAKVDCHFAVVILNNPPDDGYPDWLRDGGEPRSSDLKKLTMEAVHMDMGQPTMKV